MMRIRTAALGAAMMLAAGAAAAQQGTGQPPERRPAAEAQRGTRRAPGARKAMRARGQRTARALMRGITLSDAQKAEAKAIRQRYRPRMRALRDSLRPVAAEARAARQRGDSAAARAAWERGAATRQRMRATAEEMRGDLRGILTAEQRATLDANVKAMRERRGRASEGRGQHGQHGHRGRRGAQRTPAGT